MHNDKIKILSWIIYKLNDISNRFLPCLFYIAVRVRDHNDYYSFLHFYSLRKLFTGMKIILLILRYYIVFEY